MALVKYGGGILDMRGSIGGQVHSRNRSGSYIRARTKPINPNTERQSRIRGLMSAVSKDWFDALTGSQRDDWFQYAANVPSKNKLGEVINLSGFNQYTKSNMAALNAALPAILDGPAIFTLPGEDATSTATAAETTQLISLVFDDSRDWVDEDDAAMIVQVGLPQNESIEFFNGPWRHAGTVPGDGTTAPTTPAEITSPWNIVENQKLFVRTRIIRSDGRLSDWFQLSLICGS